ncbi:MAG: hypothetical protein ABI821_20960 [Pseudomonadota bacterium]
MAHPGVTLVPFLVVLPLIGWRLYRRVRSSIGRQKLSKVRPWVTVVVFPLLTLLIGFATIAHPLSLVWLVGGVCAGAALGMFGISKTRFENSPQGMFYTPNAHLGIALSVVFTARVLFRMFELYSMDPGAQPVPMDFARSPLTLAIFGLLAGYYATYASGLIRWRFRSSNGVSPAVD